MWLYIRIVCTVDILEYSWLLGGITAALFQAPNMLFLSWSWLKATVPRLLCKSRRCKLQVLDIKLLCNYMLLYPSNVGRNGGTVNPQYRQFWDWRKTGAIGLYLTYDSSTAVQSLYVCNWDSTCNLQLGRYTNQPFIHSFNCTKWKKVHIPINNHQYLQKC